MPTPPNHAWYVPRVLKFYKNDIALCAILVLLIPFNSITSRFIGDVWGPCALTLTAVQNSSVGCATIYPFICSWTLTLFPNLLFFQCCWEPSCPHLCVSMCGNFSREGEARPNPWGFRLLFGVHPEVTDTRSRECGWLWCLCVRGLQRKSPDITTKNHDHGSLSPVYVPEPSNRSTYHRTTLLEGDLNALCRTF